MPFTEAGDLRIYYELAGRGPRLLYFNGTGGDLRARPNVFDSPLADRFTLLSHDQRGLGRTAIPDPPYTMGDYADDAAQLLDVLGWDRCHVVGVSFGGMVAQEFALRHPERVDRLVLCCTSSGGAGGASFPFHEIGEIDDEERFRMMLPVTDLRQDAAWQASHPEEVAEMREAFRARRAIGAGEPRRALGAAAQIEARRHHDTHERLPNIAAPVLVAAGRHDGIAPVRNSEALVERLGRSQLAVFEGGHLFLLQDRTAYPRIASFLLGEEGG